jgi:hypothetical protein
MSSDLAEPPQYEEKPVSRLQKIITYTTHQLPTKNNITTKGK